MYKKIRLFCFLVAVVVVAKKRGSKVNFDLRVAVRRAASQTRGARRYYATHHIDSSLNANAMAYE